LSGQRSRSFLTARAARRPRSRSWRGFVTTVSLTSIVLAMLGTATTPVASAGAAPTTIYVANAGDPSTVTVIDGATDVVERSIPIRNYTAVGIAVAPEGKEAYAIATGSDELGSPGRLVPISTATNTAAAAINVGTDPQSIAFNPNGRFAYVVNGFDAATTAPNAPGTITPVNLAEGSAGHPIKVGTNPGEMAISPDGRIAYVADSNALTGTPTTITPVNLSTNTPEAPIHVGALDIAFTLNGQSALALTSSGVVPIATATNRPGRLIAMSVPQAIVLAPDGQTAWVLTTPDPAALTGLDTVDLTAINTATFAIGKVVALPGMPATGQFFLAITPNGAHIYGLGQGSGKSASTLVAIDASTDVASRAIKVGVDDTALAVSPDSRFVYVLTPGSDFRGAPIASQPKKTAGSVIPISAANEKIGAPIRAGLLGTAMSVAP
jgi:DNA-binding beta-propeller fold protein YncE